MTSMFSPGAGATATLESLRAKWGWIVALGVVYLIAGLIALGSVAEATAATVFIIGVVSIVAGAFHVVHAFQLKTWGRTAIWLIMGVLYVIAGFLFIDSPFLTALWLTLFLGAALVASGLVRIYLAFNMKHGSSWVWVVLSGLITLFLGGIILAHWPNSAIYTLGIFLGVDLVFAGAGWIGLGLGLRKAVV